MIWVRLYSRQWRTKRLNRENTADQGELPGSCDLTKWVFKVEKAISSSTRRNGRERRSRWREEHGPRVRVLGVQF